MRLTHFRQPRLRTRGLHKILTRPLVTEATMGIAIAVFKLGLRCDCRAGGEQRRQEEFAMSSFRTHVGLRHGPSGAQTSAAVAFARLRPRLSHVCAGHQPTCLARCSEVPRYLGRGTQPGSQVFQPVQHKGSLAKIFACRQGRRLALGSGISGSSGMMSVLQPRFLFVASLGTQPDT